MNLTVFEEAPVPAYRNPIWRPSTGSVPGLVRRRPTALAAGAPEADVDHAKRNSLKLMAVGALVIGGAAAGGAGALNILTPPMAGASSYPRVQLLYEDGSPVVASQYKYTYKDNGQVIFDYPLTNEPNMLLNIGTLGSPSPQNPIAKGDGTYMVAYSALCQHLGCVPPYVSYYPPGQCGSFNGGQAIIHCVCHGSTYDPCVKDSSNGGGAKVLTGPTVLPLPQVLLETDSSGNIYAVGMIGPAVKGHTNTLSGGTAVTSPARLSPVETPTQSCPT